MEKPEKRPDMDVNKATCYEALHQAAREMVAAEHAVQEAFVRTGNRWFTPGIPPALERRANEVTG